MTFEIALVSLILLFALILFLTGWVRMDIVALSVLTILAASGLITTEAALAGFGNPAVVIVWAMFILSASIHHTGVARIIGAGVIRYAGRKEWRVTLVIMVSSAMLSTIMSNIGVTALMLPVVMDVARRTGNSPARLLIPLAFAAHLGGLTTLIGTPANLLVSFALTDAGYEPLRMFDFTPVAGVVMIAGVIFMTFAGRFLLPKSKSVQYLSKHKQFTSSYHLEESTFRLFVEPDSMLINRTLEQARLRTAMGINVLSLVRNDGTTLYNPGPDTRIKSQDKLNVQGRYNIIKSMQNCSVTTLKEQRINVNNINTPGKYFYEMLPGNDSPLSGITPQEIEERSGNTIRVLCVKESGKNSRKFFYEQPLQPNDLILIVSDTDNADVLVKKYTPQQIHKTEPTEILNKYRQEKSFKILHVCESIYNEKEMGPVHTFLNAFDYSVAGLFSVKNQNEETLEAADKPSQRMLLIFGPDHYIPLMNSLLSIPIKKEQISDAESLETEEVIMAEAVLAPRSMLAGKTLSEINFRKKYGLNVLAFWREGKALRTQLHNTPLRFGEALLLYGKREKVNLLEEESDFILLTETIKPGYKTKKATTSVLILAITLFLVITGVLPLAISVIMGVIAMVLMGCIKMEEAYRSIDWRSVFLIAGMLPLGIAIETTGAAALVAGYAEYYLGFAGPYAMLATLYMLTLMATLAIHPAALIVIMAPIVIQTAENFAVSPHSFMIAIAIAASGSFLSPVAHPANLIVMAPGGYSFKVYIKAGLPLSLLVMIIVFALIPVFWPL